MTAQTSRIRLLGIAGSLRREAYSKAVLRGLAEAVVDKAHVEIFDLAGIPLYNQDEDGDKSPDRVVALRKLIAASDGLILVSPEYNYGIPGVLKNALDWASRPAYQSAMKGKHTLIISTSPGMMGGVRAQAQIVQTLHGMLARPLVWPQVAIAKVAEKVRDGKLADQAALKYCTDALDGLLNQIRREQTLGADLAA